MLNLKQLIESLVHNHHLFYAPIVIDKFLRSRYKINSAHFLSSEDYFRVTAPSSSPQTSNIFSTCKNDHQYHNQNHKFK